MISPFGFSPFGPFGGFGFSPFGFGLPVPVPSGASAPVIFPLGCRVANRMVEWWLVNPEDFRRISCEDLEIWFCSWVC